MNLNGSSGVLSGTPTTPGSFTFAISASNLAGVATTPDITIVVKKPLTVTAPTLTREYGSANPALTAAYIGFLPGETAASLTTVPTCTTTAGTSSPPGDYPVTCDGGVSSRYAFTYVPGKLTVTKATTSTRVVQTPVSAPVGTPVTLTATVTDAGTPTGTVQFKTAAGNLGPPVPLSGGQASLTTTGDLSDKPIVTADYSGDALHEADVPSADVNSTPKHARHSMSIPPWAFLLTLAAAAALAFVYRRRKRSEALNADA
jgi:hypothetical protein